MENFTTKEKATMETLSEVINEQEVVYRFRHTNLNPVPHGISFSTQKDGKSLAGAYESGHLSVTGQNIQTKEDLAILSNILNSVFTIIADFKS